MDMATKPGIDLDKFRLRTLVERLIDMGEVAVHDQPIELSELSHVIESTPKATLFRRAGPEQHPVVGGVMGSRVRLAAAFGVEPKALQQEYSKRLASPQPVVQIESRHAPVHQVVL